MFMRHIVLLVLLASFAAGAAIETRRFGSLAQEQQYRELTRQLRCPKCQNNSIADSDAIIAADMREKVYQLMQQGRTNRQIVDYMVARYGNFVTYVPPVNPLTFILWAAPLLAVALGALIILWRGARRGRSAEPLTAEEQQRLAQLLDTSDRKRS